MGDERRALVLGGGGITGIAWMYGLVAGLAADGIDLTGADLVVGTSAGSAVGANLAAGRDPEALLETQLAPPSGEIAANLGLRLAVRYGVAALAGPRDARRVRARIGRMALAADTVGEAERLAAIGSRLGDAGWPSGRDLWITAVDAYTGDLRVFTRDDGVPLATAVAASCAVPGVWPPVTAAGTRWIDGGVRSMANADLAAGYGRVVVLAPLTGGLGSAVAPRVQAEALGALGRVACVEPDRRARRAFGRNVLDPARRPAAARAGRAQAAGVAAEIARVWG
ncbi:Patatin [Pseudonocardia sp. Ae168_Ps1]|uniref:patatin-like phospholipase family protein n=1 Tax=unclassified Pseudonocardia TaxID=2619320 RepID=UPI00094B445C|nr:MULTISPECIES: patatin-like phospholipase family protein [unclassified Pseudonocardia]OLL74261.1 Patatin [Pseudonocardia sp. Ae150A_Ps1]OLL80242.1 Patatin [Pseudonocardia sp. Ae168_Ps1]OLL85631.1 Patatin [Pseudonocardia sp. Ae263_Ps1]OLL94340.1 Patatin [Pseudonocardia sp. Ae356_Ps1]